MRPGALRHEDMGSAGMLAWMEKPCDALRAFVRAYTFRDDWLGSLRVYNPLPARGDCFLQFYFDDRYQVVNVSTGEMHVAPRCVLVGPHTRRREDLLCTGHLKMFTIHFSAVGFRALFGVPAREIVNFADSAELVLGAAVMELESRLAEADGLGLVDVAEAYLMELRMRSEVAGDGGVMARIVRALRVSHGAASIAAVAGRYELSVRQVERGFQEHVGVTPKMYARLQRMGFAMKVGGGMGTQDWSAVAATAGFFDQSHMVREFRDMNGATPVQFMALREEMNSLLRVHWSEERRSPGGDVAFVLSQAAARG